MKVESTGTGRWRWQTEVPNGDNERGFEETQKEAWKVGREREQNVRQRLENEQKGTNE